MNSNSIKTKHLFRSPLICRICGDVARGMNFDVMTCMACKAFFRRNALQPLGTSQCTRKSNCEITVKTRTKCPDCRLKKCFQSGMKAQLIRSVTRHQTVCYDVRQVLTTNKQYISLPTPEPLDFFQNNHSIHITEQCNLLSNFMHIDDEHNMFNNIKCLFINGSSLPARLPVEYYFH
ncbi:unnamed protein product [Rotaria sp. Silwood1]|nr:unnamed protein product [Rotaria sp. Silwood1]